MTFKEKNDMPLLALRFLKPLMTILTFGLTIPVWAVLGAYLWVQFDKTSTVRQAVDRAVTQLVTGAELEAEKAKREALEKIVAELEGQNEALESANQRFSQNLREAQLNLENANDEIRELAVRPVNNKCVVDESVLNILRNK